MTTFNGLVNENLLPETVTEPLLIARSSSIYAGNNPAIQSISRMPHLRRTLRVAAHPGANDTSTARKKSRVATGTK